MKQIAQTKSTAAKTIFKAFEILKENGDEMRRNELIEKLGNSVQFEAWELERYPSNNQYKWLTVFLYATIDCMKAGWLLKDKGTWYLTQEGKNAMKMGSIKMVEFANRQYWKWKNNTPSEEYIPTTSNESDVDINNEQIQKATLDELESQASDSIGRYLESIDPYKFQKIASILLKRMGFYIEEVAQPGPDGGIDIIAYKDPLGIEKPRIKVQVKNYKESNKVDVKPIRELKGLLNANEHVGVFITSSYFTKEAVKFARQSDIHIKLIDRDNLIELWKANYNKMSEEEKSLLPLQPIYFLGNLEV